MLNISPLLMAYLVQLQISVNVLQGTLSFINKQFPFVTLALVGLHRRIKRHFQNYMVLKCPLTPLPFPGGHVLSLSTRI